MNLSIAYLFLIYLLLNVTLTEKSSIIQLDQIYTLALEPKTPKSFEVSIGSIVKNETQLYISAQPISNDPYQIPEMSITSLDAKYTQTCFNAGSQYTDICAIPTEELTLNRTFIIKVQCLIKCQIQLSAYLNQVLKLDIGDSIVVTAMDDYGLAEAIQVQIPTNLNYTQLIIYAKIENINQVNQGLALRVNYGSKSSSIPTLTNYSQQGQSTWDDAVTVVLSKQQVKPGQWLKILLYTTQKMKVRFTTQIINGNNFNIQLNQDRYDFVSYGENRIYTLDLTKKMDQIKDDNLDIIFTIYSGSPDIQVSFTTDFNSDATLSNNYISGKVNCLITPELRKQFNFTGIVYIKIQSFWSATFHLQVILNKKDFIPLTQQVTQVSRLQNKDIDNFLYQSIVTIKDGNNKTDSQLNILVKIEMIQGSAMFGIRRCKSLESNNSLECLLKKQNMNQKNVLDSFNQIQGTIQKSYSTYQISIIYDPTLCPSKRKNQTNQTVYNCIFQIIGVEDSNQPSGFTKFALTLYQRSFSVWLKEGQQVKDTVMSQNYHYYKFTLPSIENVTQVAFFLTTIQGDCLILSSKSIKFPSLFEIGNSQIALSTQNMIIYSGDQLSKIFYIGIYGYQTSDYTLTASVRRKSAGTNKSVELTQIQLKQSVGVTYTIAEGQQNLLFSLRPKVNSTIQIIINSLQGYVTYYVNVVKYDKNRQQYSQSAPCKQQGSICELNTNPTLQQQYLVLVTGKKTQTQVFTIVYNYPQKNTCLQYPMNFPLVMEMDQDSKRCLKYIIKNPKDLQILISLSSLQLLTGSIVANLKVSDSNLKIQQHQKRISKQQLIILCHGEDKYKPCQVFLEFIARNKLTFQVLLEEVGNQLALFDGISQKIVTQDLSQTIGKYFHYSLYTKDNLKIFFIAQTKGKYQVNAIIINESTYLTSSLFLFPLFNSPDNRFLRNTTNKVTIIPISKIEQFNCKSCILLISVYRIDGQENDISAFNIQVTQTTSSLELGQSKIGYVEQGEISSYEVMNKDIESSLVSVSWISNDKCAKIIVAGDEQDQNANQQYLSKYKSYASLKGINKKFTIDVEGTKQCAYIITFYSNKDPVHQIMSSIPYTVTLTGMQNDSIENLLYYHQSNDTFRIVQTVEAGDAALYVRPLKTDDILNQILTQTPQQFPFNSQGYNDLQIFNTDKKYCSKCYYLIVIKTKSSIKQDVIILPKDKAIPLKQNSILKDRLNKQQINNYLYHSIDSFNISIGVLYGEIQISIIGPNQTNQIQQTISSSKQYIIRPSPQAMKTYINLFDQKSKFTINIKGTTPTAYYIQIKKHNYISRIKQGLPVILDLTSRSNGTTLEFVNINCQQPINVLIQVITNSTTDSLISTANALEFNVQVQKDKPDKQQQKLIKQIIRSQNSYNLLISSYMGTYFINIKISQSLKSTLDKLKISLLLVKKNLTHLVSTSSSLFSTPGIFEIYNSNNSLMIQIFNCKGQVQVRASQNYTQLIQDNDGNNPGQIVMQHTNYGGHYVITADKIDGQYFLQTLNRAGNQSKDQLLYLISYYRINKNQLMPYKKLYLENQKINFRQTNTSILFQLKPILPKPGISIEISQILYNILISKDTKSIQEYAQCSIGQSILKKGFTTQLNFANASIIQIQVQYKQLQKLVGNTSNTFFVGAMAIVSLNSTNTIKNSPTQLYYIYNILQTSQKIVEVPGAQKSSTIYILIWIVLPFLLGSFFLMISCRYCIRRFYATYYPTELIEQDQFGASQDALKNQGQSPAMSIDQK